MSVQGLKSGMNQALRADTSPRYAPAIKVNKPTATGFLDSIDEEVWLQIHAATVVVLSIEVTAPTRFHPPVRISNWTHIGDLAWETYRGLYPGVRADCRPRVRALAVKLDGRTELCFDWDTVPDDQQKSLLETLFRKGKVIVGHDLASTLSWLFAETNARPECLVDTMLLVHHVKPKILYLAHALAAMEGTEWAALASNVLRKQEGRPALTLQYVAMCLRLPTAAIEHSEAWSVTTLSRVHHQHCSVTLNNIEKVLVSLVPVDKSADRAQSLRTIATISEDYAKATVRLAEAHLRGVPLDRTALKRLRQYIRSEADLPANLSTTKDRLLRNWALDAEHDDRMHSIVTFSTVTGRTSSKYPGMQAIPRDPQWRSLIRAREGHCILAVDYSAMELRIAAALAARAVTDIEARLTTRTRDDWWVNLVASGLGSEKQVFPRFSDLEPKQWNRLATIAVSQRVLGNGEQTMRSVLRQGTDPHLVTAAEFARKAGKLTFAGRSQVWIADLDGEARAKLKSDLAEERQAAKACNFGLLYGMSPSGLHEDGLKTWGLQWSIEEAAQARDAWFELYPELLLWQFWTGYCQSRPITRELRLYDSETRQLKMADHWLRFHETTTLKGRPVFAMRKTQALAGQGQGTGADILARAITRLPQEVAEMFLLPVHDELLFEIPQTNALQIKAIVEGTMRQAAADIIGDDIPVLLESSIAESWA